MYHKVLYNPLMVDEAEPCLKEVVIKVNHAVKELHNLGFQHGNLIFRNICYNKMFKPVQIDLD